MAAVIWQDDDAKAIEMGLHCLFEMLKLGGSVSGVNTVFKRL
jgi:hypothetical protein